MREFQDRKQAADATRAEVMRMAGLTTETQEPASKMGT